MSRKCKAVTNVRQKISYISPIFFSHNPGYIVRISWILQVHAVAEFPLGYALSALLNYPCFSFPDINNSCRKNIYRQMDTSVQRYAFFFSSKVHPEYIALCKVLDKVESNLFSLTPFRMITNFKFSAMKLNNRKFSVWTYGKWYFKRITH